MSDRTRQPPRAQDGSASGTQVSAGGTAGPRPAHWTRGVRAWITLGLVCCALLWQTASIPALDPARQLSQFGHQRWTRLQGLPQDSARVLAQALDGALWIGTDEGLSRFDGTEFQHFNRGDAGLPSGSITALAAARDGSMWVRTLAGVAHFRNGVFRTFDRRQGLEADYISGLVEAQDGTVWAVGGRVAYAIRAGQVIRYGAAEGVPDAGLREVVETRDGVLVGAGIGAVVQFDGVRFRTLADGGSLAGHVALALAEGRDGALWVAGTRGLVEVQRDGRTRAYAAPDGLPEDVVPAVEVDRHGGVWAGTQQGLARLEGERFVQVPALGLSPVVWELFEDRDGSLWVGTNAALHQFREQIFSVFGSSEGFPSDQPSVVYQHPDGALWIGFRDRGVMRRQNGVTTRFTQQDGLPANEVFSIRGAADGSVLVGTRLGLGRIRDGRVLVTTPADPLARTSVYDAIEDRQGRLWLGTHDGVIRIDGTRQERVIAGSPLLSSAVVALALGPDGAVWAGTYAEGLWRYDPSGDRRLFTTADGLPSNGIRALVVDAAGVLWIGTVEGGLAWRRNGAFGRLGPAEGLESGNVGQIVDDGDHLWLGTTLGLAHVPKTALFGDGTTVAPGTPVPHLFITADGLRSSNCAPGFPVAGGGTRDRDGRIWIPTANGLASLLVSDLRPPAEPGPTHITAVIVDGQPADRLDGLTIGSGARRVEFHYSATSLAAPERLRYRYRLEGLDTGWTNAGARRSADYVHLGPGEYRFIVEASLVGGAAGPAGALAFTREARWYERTWSAYAVSAGILALAWLAYWIRLRQLRGRFAIVLDERNRISRELHDTLAQDFVGISSQLGAVASTLRTDPDAAEHRLALARRMTQHSLTEARRSVMDLRSSALTGRHLLDAIRAVAGEMTAGGDVVLEVSGRDPATGTDDLPDDIAQQVLRIAQEAVANAVKHARPGRIHIALARRGGTLTLSVHDDGTGFDPSQAFVSARGHFGLLGMRERARRVGGDLRVESAPGSGTTIHVTVPIP